MSPRATLGLLTVLSAQTCLAGQQQGSPETIDLPGTVRDFHRSHADFDVMPVGGPGHNAALVHLTLGDGDVPALAGAGFQVESEWRNSGLQPIAPHMYMVAFGGGGVVQLVNGPVIDNNPTIDTWDSSRGPYGGDNVGPPPDFEIGAAMPEVIVPTGLPWTDELNYNGNGTSVLNSDVHCNKFEVTNNHTLLIGGNVTIVADELFKTQNNVEVELLPGATLAIYALKDLELQDHADLNVNTGNPSLVSIYYMDDEAFKISNHTQVYARIVAPLGELEIENNGDLYGGYTGQDFHIKNSGGFHVDTAGVVGSMVCGDPLNDTAGMAGDTNDAAISSPTTFDQWYRDTLGVNLSMIQSVTLIRDGAGIYEYLDDSFYPVDGLLFGNEGDFHNNFFTYTIEARFEYASCSGQFIEFRGADDAWLFIDGAMVIDLGGIVPGTEQVIELDRLGLQDGDEYTMQLFYAQRAAGGSQFNLRTNVELWTDHSFTITYAGD